MKNKIILAVLCVVLLLLLTSLSYGGWGYLKPRPLEPKADPPVKLREARFIGDLPPRDPGGPDQGDPWDRCLSPLIDEERNSDVVPSVVNLWFLYIGIPIK